MLQRDTSHSGTKEPSNEKLPFGPIELIVHGGTTGTVGSMYRENARRDLVQ